MSLNIVIFFFCTISASSLSPLYRSSKQCCDFSLVNASVSIFSGFPLWVNNLELSRCSLPSGLVLNSNELSFIFQHSIAGSLFAPSMPGHTWGALMWKWWGFSIMQQLPLHKREMGQAVPQDLFNCSTPHFPFLWVSSILRQLKYCLLSRHTLPEVAAGHAKPLYHIVKCNLKHLNRLRLHSQWRVTNFNTDKVKFWVKITQLKGSFLAILMAERNYFSFYCL